MHEIARPFRRIFQNSRSIKCRLDSNFKHSDHAMLKNVTCVALLPSNVKYLLQNLFVCFTGWLHRRKIVCPTEIQPHILDVGIVITTLLGLSLKNLKPGV